MRTQEQQPATDPHERQERRQETAEEQLDTVDPVEYKRMLSEAGQRAAQEFTVESQNAMSAFAEAHEGQIPDGLQAELAKLDDEAQAAQGELEQGLADSQDRTSGGGGDDGEPNVPEKQATYIEDDPRLKNLIEVASLNYLRTQDTDFFQKNFDEDAQLNEGGLVRLKDGKERAPSTFVTGGYSEVVENARQMFADDFPEEFAQYEEAEQVRIYEKPSDDPAVQDFMNDARVRANNATPTLSRDATDILGWKEKEYMRNVWFGIEGWIAKYPEKAAAYASMEKDDELVSNFHMRIRQAWEKAQQQASEQETVEPAVEEAAATEGAIEGALEVEYSLENVQQAILEARQKHPAEKKMQNSDLRTKPYISANEMNLVLNAAGDSEGLRMVKTDAIIGSVSPTLRSWESEVGIRTGRHEEVAEELLDGDIDEAIDHVFHPNDPYEQIRLKKIDGPGGPVYWVVDGSHRVGGVKLAELSQMPAEVENTPDTASASTRDPQLKGEWKKRIRAGLIDGRIEEKQGSDGEIYYQLQIDNQALPWMHMEQYSFVRMSRHYDSLYPGALDEVAKRRNVPKEVFTDEAAMNMLIAGRREQLEEYAETLRQK